MADRIKLVFIIFHKSSAVSLLNRAPDVVSAFAITYFVVETYESKMFTSGNKKLFNATDTSNTCN